MWFLLGDWQIFVNLTPEAGDVAFTRPEVTSHIYSYVIGTSNIYSLTALAITLFFVVFTNKR